MVSSPLPGFGQIATAAVMRAAQDLANDGAGDAGATPMRSPLKSWPKMVSAQWVPLPLWSFTGSLPLLSSTLPGPLVKSLVTQFVMHLNAGCSFSMPVFRTATVMSLPEALNSWAFTARTPHVMLLTDEGLLPTPPPAFAVFNEAERHRGSSSSFGIAVDICQFSRGDILMDLNGGLERDGPLCGEGLKARAFGDDISAPGGFQRGSG